MPEIVGKDDISEKNDALVPP